MQKYSRTYHYPFSPGTTSDDRINQLWDGDLAGMTALVHTEKLDGENNCLNRYGVYARSHAAPTRSPWTASLRQHWNMIRHDLGDLEIFGENLYAIHSIRYEQLPSHFFVFAIREGDWWLSWEEVKFYAQLLDLPTVPELQIVPAPLHAPIIRQQVIGWACQPSRFGSVDARTGVPCTMEGLVSREAAPFMTERFANQVFKYVRAGHVQTDEHWTRNWQRAPLKWETT